MTSFGWPDCPAAVRAQVMLIVDLFGRILAGDLVGIYLHGSLAMGCFNPERSDLDLLIVAVRRLTLAEHHALQSSLVSLSRAPSPIELSVLARDDLHPWSHPAPYLLHYSESWRGRIERDLASDAWREWEIAPKRDPDLAAHVTVVRQRGICLAGAPTDSILPEVPARDYWQSIAADAHEVLDNSARNPVYAILNACRVAAFVADRAILSKDEGGEWGLRALPARWHAAIAAALSDYRGDGSPMWDDGELQAFAAFMASWLEEHAPVV
jgi:predicted nucleotidyltransferase